MSGSWWSKVRNFFSATDEYRVNASSLGDSAANVTDVYNSVSEVRRGVTAAPRRRASKIEIAIFNAEDFADDDVMTNAIADALHDNKTVIANMTDCDSRKRSRVIDFASGMVYMIDGDVNRIDKFIYMFSTGDCHVTVRKPHDDEQDISNYDYGDYRRSGYSSRS